MPRNVAQNTRPSYRFSGEGSGDESMTSWLWGKTSIISWSGDETSTTSWFGNETSTTSWFGNETSTNQLVWEDESYSQTFGETPSKNGLGMRLVPYEPPHEERSLGLVYPSCIESHFKMRLIWILTCSC